MESVSPEAAVDSCVGRNPKKLIRYWHRCLWESMLRDPKVKQGIPVEDKQVEAGQLPLSVFSALAAQMTEHNTSQQALHQKLAAPERHRPLVMDARQSDMVRVLVAPYLLTPIKPGSRAQEGDAIPPFWIPAQFRPDGKLQPDPDHLPFIPRVLLDPPVGDRVERWPTPLAALDAYDRTIRKMDVDRQEGWEARFEYAKQMFVAVSGITIAEWCPTGWQREKPVIVAWEKHFDAPMRIRPLCDAWLQTETLPGALKAIVSSAANPLSIGPAMEADQLHLGHCGDRPINSEQRRAVSAIRLLKEGQAQAINGPPGTGKTSLLKTLVADAVVNAAVAGHPPPRILVTSTNNQAVKNAARALTSSGAGLPIERERWLPSLTHFAAFAASSEQAEDAEDFLLLDDLDAQAFSGAFAEKAEPYFIERFTTWWSSSRDGQEVPGEVDLVFAKKTLKGRLQRIAEGIKAKVDLVSKAEQFARDAEELRARCEQIQAEIEAVHNRRNRAEAEANAAMRELDNVSEHQTAIGILDHRARKHPLWMRWLSFWPRIEARRTALLCHNAQTLKYLPESAGPFNSLTELYMAVDVEFAARRDAADERCARYRAIVREEEQRAGALEAERAKRQEELGVLTRAFKDFEDWMAGHVDPEAAGPFDAGRRRIDVELRAKAFDLAMRMREAEFLLRRKEWDQRWVMTATKGRQGQYDRLKLLKTYAFVVPCIVATVYMAAKHCCFFDGNSDRPMELPIDLLIFDEAGQVAPDLGLPLLGLARRAVAVGDVHQLEPIENFSEASDDLLLRAEGIEGEQLQASRERGLTHVGGSVMRAFQSATTYTDTDLERPRGVLLRRHFRCVPKIIAYCNDLVYDGKLVPAKPEENTPWIAPMSWAHVRGEARKSGGSWGNKSEAEAIARWLAANRKAIEAQYGGDLDQSVAIVTPYGYQREVLKTALKRQLGEIATKVTIGTVHSLQGAERPVVVFSPTVTLASLRAWNSGRPFFDCGHNMLNVAVSRAKNAFVVIGDMGLFDESRGNVPSAVLARHLFKFAGNELLDVLPALAITVPDLVERIDGTDRHRELLAQAFAMATRRLLISSPFLTRNAIEADKVTSLIRAATERGVKVLVYSGLKASSDARGSLLKTLATALENVGACVLLTTRLHAKTLACDESLVVEGSFNWFSASRDPEREKKETSFAVWGRSAQAHITAVEAEFEALEAVPPKEFTFFC